MDEWMDEWLDGWMDGWIIPLKISHYIMGGCPGLFFLHFLYGDFGGLIHPLHIQRFLYFVL